MASFTGASMKKHLTIFGKHVPIVRTKDQLKTHEAFAMFHRDKFFIEIDHSLKGHIYYVSLIHELIHSVVQRSGIYQAGLSHELEEILAEQISVAIVENFKLK